MILRELFESALELEPSARAGFLDARCTDAGLRACVESLLRADAAPDEPVSSARLDHLSRAIGEASAPALPPGSRIGPFEIVRVIGEGGSSTVFEAYREVEGGRQCVALKLLRQNLLSPEARRRFGREQRALIRLQHTNIARMIEAGLTADGLAYIALELVDGLPITEFARAHVLGERERLQMFATVCRAVDAAHRALIVHRDIKPSNVLVTADGEVKLLDFGIAKLLADEVDPDATMLQAFTPAYAAPEQFSGGTITTATDVYALGVVLGELVTGERGPGHTTPSAGVPVTLECDAARPSQTPMRLSADLGAVLAKATEADPVQRYASAGEFAEDIRRVVEGRPVLARPQTRRYRMQRFVARHRGGVAVGIATLGALVAALSITLWQARVAHDEAARANRQAHHMEAVRDFLVSVFKAAQTEGPGERRPTVVQLVDDASDKLLRDDALAGDTGVDLLLALAEVNGAIGAYEREHALLDRATTDLSRLPAQPNDTDLRLRVLRASAYIAQFRPDEAIVLLEPLHTPLLARGDAVAVEALLVFADALSSAGRSDETQAVALDARAIAERVASGREVLLMRVDAMRAHDLVFAQKFDQGLALADAVWSRWKDPLRDSPREAFNLLASIGTAAEAKGDLQRADASYLETIAIAERLYVRPHPDTAWALGKYGKFLVSRARHAEAEPYVLRALAMRRALFGDAHFETLDALATLGRLRSGQLRRDEARAAFDEGVGLCEREHVRDKVCVSLANLLSDFLAGEGDLDGARRTAEQSVAMQRELKEECPANLFGALGTLAGIQVKLARYDAALASADEQLAIAERNGAGDSKDAHDAQRQRAVALRALGRDREVPAPASDVTAVGKEKPDEKTPAFPMPASGAGALAAELRFDEMRPLSAEALAIDRSPQSRESTVLAELARLGDGGHTD